MFADIIDTSSMITQSVVAMSFLAEGACFMICSLRACIPIWPSRIPAHLENRNTFFNKWNSLQNHSHSSKVIGAVVVEEVYHSIKCLTKFNNINVHFRLKVFWKWQIHQIYDVWTLGAILYIPAVMLSVQYPRLPTSVYLERIETVKYDEPWSGLGIYK